jgi:hypothetical protein
MKSSPCLVPVEPAHFAAYQAAARKLKRKLGVSAPTTVDLINHELSSRTAENIIESYLDGILWHHPRNAAKRQRRARR